MEQPKVFEYAKELGMETMSLMTKIREWGLPVKSHMVQLEPDMIETIQSKLAEEAEKKDAGKKKTKKKAAKKKTAAKKTAKKTATKKAAAKSPVIKKAVTRKTADAAAEEEAPKKAKVVKKTDGAVKRTVIRRKKSEVEELAAAEEAAKAEAAEKEMAAVQTTEAEATPETPTKEATEVAAKAGPAEEAATPEVADADTDGAATQVEAEGGVEATMESEVEKKEPAKPAPARKVAVNVAGGEVSGVKSHRPKNIVGRMDLSRVQNFQKGDSKGGGNATAGDAAERTPRTGAARNIRTGFVAAPDMMAPPSVQMDDRFNKKDDKKVPKKPGAGAKEAPVASFSSTEFRKREMVFQPKKKKGILNRAAKKTEITQAKASKRIVKVNETISVSDLAQEIGIKAPQLLKTLIKNGVMANMNQVLDFDTVSLIVPEFGWEAENVHKTVDDLLGATAYGDLDAAPTPRYPVVTVMGHVDHGKTTLLDTIRKANVVKGEAGGITQHIAAYRVNLGKDKDKKEKIITFIDTPGHEAFTAMRARGADVTDIAIIVVAADDGVMPQTAEAISHAKAAEVPILVAVNKVDKPEANVEKIKQQLTEYELVSEDWGGDTMFAEVSALKGDGVQEMLEQIHLMAEVMELKANAKRSGTGIVLEARMEKGRGHVSTILVKEGTVKVGQAFVAGQVSGKIRSLINDQGKTVKEAGPSMPVEVLGLPGSPLAGDQFDICQTEKEAGDIAAQRKQLADQEINTPNSKMSLEDLFAKVKTENLKELPIVLKTDVVGSSEAIKGMLAKLNTDEVKVKVIHSAVGAISESDVLLASSSGGIVIGFSVRPDNGASQAAKKEGVEVKCYNIVYELVDDIKKAMSGLLDPDIVEKVEGRAEVRETFSVPRIGTIGGCSVLDGKINRSHLLRLTRDGKVVYEGKVSSLKRFKDDVREVAQGYECGIGIENFNDLKSGDVIEAYVEEKVQREL